MRDTGILRCAGLALQDLGLWPWSTGLSKKRLQGCASDSRIRLNSFLVKFWRLVTSNSTVSLGRPVTFRHLFCILCRSSLRYILFPHTLNKFDKRSIKHFPLTDHFINSHYLPKNVHFELSLTTAYICQGYFIRSIWIVKSAYNYICFDEHFL